MLTSSHVVSMVVGVFSLIAYTRFFAPVDLALLAVYAMLSSICYQVSNLGLGLYVQRWMPKLLAEDDAAAVQLSRSFMSVTLALAAVFCLVIILAAEPVAMVLLKDASAAPYVRWMCPALLVFCWNFGLMQVMRGRSSFTELTLLLIAAAVLHPISTIVFYLLWGRMGLVIGLAVAMFTISIPGTYWHRRYVIGRLELSRTAVFVRRSWPFYVEGFLSYFKRFADQWLVGMLLTPTHLAVYYIPRTIVARAITFLESMNNVMLAHLSTLSVEGPTTTKYAFQRIQCVYIYLIVPAGLMLMVSSPFVIHLLTTPEYYGGIVPMIILGGGLLLQGLYSPYGIALVTLVDPWYRLVALVVGLLAYCTSLVPLGYSLKLNGIALAVGLSWLVQMILAGVFLKKKGFPFNFDWHAVWIVTVPSILLVGVTVLGQILYYHKAMFPAYLAVGTFLYVIAFLKVISVSEYESLVQIMPDRLQGLARTGKRVHSFLNRPGSFSCVGAVDPGKGK